MVAFSEGGNEFTYLWHEACQLFVSRDGVGIDHVVVGYLQYVHFIFETHLESSQGVHSFFEKLCDGNNAADERMGYSGNSA